MKSPPQRNRPILAATLALAALAAAFLWFQRSNQLTSEDASAHLPAKSTPGTANDLAAPAVLAPDAAATAVAFSPPLTAASGAGSIDAFAEWSKRYLAADPADRAALTAEGIALAAARRPVLKELITTDPRSALENAVPMVTRQQLPTSIVALLEERLSGTGSLEVLAVSPDSDPSEPIIRHEANIDERYWRAFVYGRRSEQMSLTSTMMNGIGIDNVMAIGESPVRPLEVGEIPDPSKKAIETCPVSGKTTAIEREPNSPIPPIAPETPAIEAGEQIIFLCDGGHIRQFVEEQLAAEGATGSATSPTEALKITRKNSTGVRRFIYMRAVFPDRLDERQTEVEAWTACRQLDEYFQEISYGKLSFQGHVTPLIVLPRTAAFYDDSDSSSQLMNDAKDIAREMGYSLENYHHYVVIFAGGPGSYGGLGSVNGSNTWLKSNSIGTFRHEIGHNIGVWHSNFWNTDNESVIGPGHNSEYGHHQDVMGGSGSGGHFNASMKQILQWITPETYHAVHASGLYRIHQFDQVNQDPGLRYAIEVPKDPEREYWIEFRQLLNSIPWYQHGASLNWSRWGRSDANGTLFGSNNGTQLLDMTAGSADVKNDSPLVIGRTHSDYEADVHITPIGKGGTTPESLDVQVNIGTAVGNSPPTLAILPSATLINPGDTVTLTANSTDPDGDTLAYHWSFGDKQPSPYFGPTFSTDNASVQNKTFATAGWYAVSCTVSDMKGGVLRDTVLIQVGTPSTFYISGNVADTLANPLFDVRVYNGLTSGSFRGTYTDSDGEYIITNLASGNHTLQAIAAGYTFAPGNFSNPINANSNPTGQDFLATQTNHVAIELVDATATEGGDTAAFRITRTGNLAAAETIYTNFSGTAGTGDYSLAPAADTGVASPLEVFTIPAGASQLDIVLTTNQDTAAEGPETLVVSLLNAGNTYLPVGPQTITLTIDDDDTTLARVHLEVTDDEAIEGAVPDPAEITVHRTGSTAAPLTVLFSRDTVDQADAVAAFATHGTDYSAIGTSIVIPVGASSAPVTITPVNDALTEGAELVEINLTANAAYILGTPTTATVKITDDDIADVTITATDPTANENGDTATFTITRTGSTTAPLEVSYSTGGDALHGTDYQPLASHVTIPAGQSSAEVLIIPIDDSHGEPAQSIVLQLRSASEYRVVTPSSATATLNDEGDLPVVAISAYDGIVEEKSSPDNGQFRLITTGTGTGNITVKYAVTGTATNGVDYTNLPGTRSMAKNSTSNIALTITDDGVAEDAETVILTILPDPAYTVDLANTATITIRDLDSVNMISVSPNLTSLTEGGTGRFFIARSGSTTGALPLTYTMGGSADASDYTAPSGSTSIPAGAIGVYVDIVTTNDSAAEGFETITLTVDPDTGAPRTYGLEVATATLPLSDNDSGFTNTLAFAQLSQTATEGDGSVSIPVSRTGSGLATSSCSIEYTVRYSSAFGTGIDFIMPTGRLEFAPGEALKNISLNLIDDVVTEDIEGIILQLRNPTGAGIATNKARSTVFILDNEPRISIEATDPFAYEPADTATFTISRQGHTTGNLVVPIAVSGTAVSGTDYTALPSNVTIPNGAESTTLILSPLANPAINSPLAVTLSLAPSSTSLPGLQTSATATIGDAESDDPPFVHLLSPSGTSPGIPSNVTLRLSALAEDDTPGTLTTTWSKLSGPGTVTFEDATLLATGATFSSNGNYTLRLTANDGGQIATLDVPIILGAPILPWTHANIGTTTYPGSAVEEHGFLAITASGQDVAGSGERIFLRHRMLDGDGEVVARVRNLFQSSSNARAGVMIRDSTANNVPFAAMHMSPAPTYSGSGNRSVYQRRTAAGGSVANTVRNGATPGWWVRLTRTGNTFRSYDSPDGVNWVERGSNTIGTLSTNALIGLSVTSATTSELTLATFDNIHITGTPENNGPLVAAGPDASTTSGVALALPGAVTDDALPSNPGTVTSTWSLVSGPGAAVFDNASSPATNVTLTAAGLYTLRLSADDGEVITSDAVAITVTHTCDSWTTENFGPDAGNPAIAGPGANPDGDDLTNLEEYGHGTDPKVANIAPLSMDVLTIGPDDFLRLTATLNPHATDLTFEVQATSDLSDPLSWSSIGLITEIDTPTTLRVRDNLPMPTGTSRFMRLKISK